MDGDGRLGTNAFHIGTWSRIFGGRDRRRSGDLTLFRRALYQLSYPTATAMPSTISTTTRWQNQDWWLGKPRSGPDGI